MKHNGFANFLSWLALLVALICIIGLGLAATLYFEPTETRGQSSGLAFLIVTSWMIVLGSASLLLGGVSIVLKTDEANGGQSWRTRLALLAGALALAVGLMYGVVFD